MNYPREGPNTPNVKVWSDKALDSLDRELLDLLKENRLQRKSAQRNNTDDENKYSEMGHFASRLYHYWMGIWMWLEFYILLGLGTSLWIYVARLIFHHLRFPTETHKVFVMAIYIGPSLFLFLIMKLIDCIYEREANRKEIKLKAL